MTEGTYSPLVFFFLFVYMSGVKLKQLPITRRYPSGIITGRLYNDRNELVKLRIKQADRIIWVNV